MIVIGTLCLLLLQAGASGPPPTAQTQYGRMAPPVLTEVTEGTPGIGAVDGVRTTFTLSTNPSGIVTLFYNGVRQRLGADYRVQGRTLTLVAWKKPPMIGDALDVAYWTYQ